MFSKAAMMLAVMLCCLAAAKAQEPYAVLSDNYTVLTFYYDNQKANRNGMDVGPFSGSDNPSWFGRSTNITSVVIDASFAGCTTLTSTAYWFYNLQNISAITGISNLKTDNVTSMCSMFEGCRSLTSLDLSGFKTDKVTDMNYMFYNCRSLTSLDLSRFKTGKVTDMGGMFMGCSGLTSLNVTGFNTENVTYMDFMFQGCSSLTSLDLSGFKTDNVENMGNMFYGCSCLTSLDLTGFNTGHVETMAQMFSGCSTLTTIYAGDGWSTANVQYSVSMFNGCNNLVGGAGTPFDAYHIDHTYARIDGGSASPGYFTVKPEGTGDWAEGDLNHDGKVDAADVVWLTNLIMNQK